MDEPVTIEILPVEVMLMVHSFVDEDSFGPMLLTFRGLSEHYVNCPWDLVAYQNSRLKVHREKYVTYQHDYAILRGNLHGTYTITNTVTGVVTKQTHYEHGVKYGPKTKRYSSGQLQSTATYDVGVHVETSHVYYENGQLFEERYYPMVGETNGTCKRWHPDGVLVYERYNGRDDDVSDSDMYYPDGTIRTKKRILNDMIYIESWYLDGKRQQKYTYNLEQLRHGKYRCWHENGNISRLRNYNNGVKVGESWRWHNNGSLMKYVNRYAAQRVPGACDFIIITAFILLCILFVCAY